MPGLSVFSLVEQPAAAFDGETADSPIRTISLSDYIGKWLVYFWYPLEFTAVPVD